MASEMSMREKMARAMLAKDYPDDAGGEMEGFWWDRHGDRYLDMADTALDALMEPTEAMLEDAFATHDQEHGEVEETPTLKGIASLLVGAIRAAKVGK